MTLQQLEYIVALDNHRHFVKAAEDCFVTQPTLTMQVHKLEEEMGVTLFDRGKRPLEPTGVGEVIILKARQILREMKEMKAFIQSETESLKGEFRVGIIPTLAPYLIPLFIKDFATSNRETLLKIQELQTEVILESLKADRLDIGILVTPLNDNHIREIPMFYEPFLLYTHPGQALYESRKVAMDMLDGEGLLLLDEGHCFREQALNICQARGRGSFMGIEYQSGSIEALINMVDRGMGYTLVPELAVDHKETISNIRRFVTPEPVREVSIVVHNSFTREKLIGELHRCILKNIPKSFVSQKKRFKVQWR